MHFLFALVLGLTAHAADIRTIAGNGQPGSDTQLNNPYGLRIGPDGAMYLCDIGSHRIRRVDLKTGVPETFAGTGGERLLRRRRSGAASQNE